MKKEFLIDRQGKQFVLYAGLLDAAHAAGLQAIRTRLVQPPLEVNNWTTIVSAEVTFTDTRDGTIRVFEGIGDANEKNVGRNIAPHAIRMAETRAKARALRDALNINAVSLEEMGDDDETTAQKSAEKRNTAQPTGDAAWDALEKEQPAVEALPGLKGYYEAEELRAFRRQGKAPPNLESAASRFVQTVKEVDAQRFASFGFGNRKGPALLDWLIEAETKWDASPDNPRHPRAAVV